MAFSVSRWTPGHKVASALPTFTKVRQWSSECELNNNCLNWESSRHSEKVSHAARILAGCSVNELGILNLRLHPLSLPANTIFTKPRELQHTGTFCVTRSFLTLSVLLSLATSLMHGIFIVIMFMEVTSAVNQISLENGLLFTIFTIFPFFKLNFIPMVYPHISRPFHELCVSVVVSYFANNICMKMFSSNSSSSFDARMAYIASTMACHLLFFLHACKAAVNGVDEKGELLTFFVTQKMKGLSRIHDFR